MFIFIHCYLVIYVKYYKHILNKWIHWKIYNNSYLKYMYNNNYILPLPLFILETPFLIPIGILHLGGGDLGLSTSIRSVHPVVNWPLLKYPLYISVLKLELVSSFPNVSHPGRIVLSRPNKCNLKVRTKK